MTIRTIKKRLKRMGIHELDLTFRELLYKTIAMQQSDPHNHELKKEFEFLIDELKNMPFKDRVSMYKIYEAEYRSSKMDFGEDDSASIESDILRNYFRQHIL